MLLGFTFPFFWAYHAGGFADFLFRPIQIIVSTESKIGPSFFTAFLLYAVFIFGIEFLSRPRKRTLSPELHTLHQQPQPDHESSSPDHCTETEQDLPHHPASSDGPEESSPKTDQ